MIQKAINNQTMVEVFNDSTGNVGYKTATISRDFMPKSKKDIEVKELIDLLNTPGGKYLLDTNKLLIKNRDVRNFLGIEPIDDYNLTRDLANEILASGDLVKLEQVLQYCSDESLTKIVEEAIAMSISSIPQANLIKAYSGYDIIEAIAETKAPGAEVAAQPNKVRKKLT